ncbi:MAG TPA: M67 family metallopeptidase [Leptolyngbyaceae cyanobacterium M65_K2018_010]|nr:M67 family metallopeptidase [Leptolyngbyaceae cyanobacterium M65_K2018_010]
MTQALVSVYPQEGCGLILGQRVFLGAAPRADDDRRVEAVIPVENSWNPAVLEDLDLEGAHSLRDRYWIDPVTMLKVQRSARSQGLEIIGIYHSHPDHPAVPSECDRRLAWPVYSYLIASVTQGQITDLQSWRLNEAEQFQPEPVKILGSSTNNSQLLS